MTKTQEQTMEMERFWDFVTNAAWGAENNVSKCKRRLRVSLQLAEEAEAFRRCFNEVQGALMKRVEEVEENTGQRLGCGDDSFGDLTAHIIGLGKQAYDDAMDDVFMGVFERASKGAYVESFAYAIPYEEDFAVDREEQRSRQAHRDKVAKALEEQVCSAMLTILRAAEAQVPNLAKSSPAEYYVGTGVRRALVMAGWVDQ